MDHFSVDINISQISGVKIGTADGWLSFIGALFAGIITMSALYFTIQNENTKRNVDSKHNSMPIVKIDVLHKRVYTLQAVKEYFADISKETAYFRSSRKWYLIVQNVSNNVARNIRINSVYLEFWKVDDNGNLSECINKSPLKVRTSEKSLIPIFDLFSTSVENPVTNLNNLPSKTILLVIDTEYSDVTKRNVYRNISKSHFLVTSNQIKLYLSKNDFFDASHD